METPAIHPLEGCFRAAGGWAFRPETEPSQGGGVPSFRFENGEPVRERNMLRPGENPRMNPRHDRKDEIGPVFPPTFPAGLDACTDPGGGLPYARRRHHECDGPSFTAFMEER